ncbi:dicarboxylate/amino acid:cation symporter [Algimonas porphyrae]|uniref:Glutamate:proton symporter n=1 Tax=Algimonas porphyrae TaxID=1128113 RepID=A0ABQ5V1L7_9PROT|nr:dicarboxylate/amino acid:cation symporter [Algimonas porphyrae]GLQ21361.1 glutamate:proton symporter [Algimonas porphyrae]
MLNRLIAIGLILGLCVGLGAAATDNPLLQAIARESAPLGQIFINAIRMVVIPLVVAIIFASVARLGDLRKLGRIGGLTLAFYWLTLVPAILLGMGIMTLGLRFVPDIVMPAPDALTVPELRGITDFLIGLVPANPFAAAANGAILPLIVFTSLLAAAAGTLAEERRLRMVQAADDISAALIKLVWWILLIAPLGVFGLIAPATAQIGWELVQSLGVFIICVAIALILFVGLIYVPLIWAFRRIGPILFVRQIAGAVTIAFSTTSTATAIPVSREEATKNLGVSETTADLIIPLGASMYRPGSALFQGAAIIFLAHLYGVPLAMGAAGAILLATFLVSLTVAPVPSSSVVTMAPALQSIGVPVAGLALILGIDRIPDMLRSSVNVMGQITAAVCVDGKQE